MTGSTSLMKKPDKDLHMRLAGLWQTRIQSQMLNQHHLLSAITSRCGCHNTVIVIVSIRGRVCVSMRDADSPCPQRW